MSVGSKQFAEKYIKKFKDNIDLDVIDETWTLDCVIHAIEKAIDEAYDKGWKIGYDYATIWQELE